MRDGSQKSHAQRARRANLRVRLRSAAGRADELRRADCAYDRRSERAAHLVLLRFGAAMIVHRAGVWGFLAAPFERASYFQHAYVQVIVARLNSFAWSAGNPYTANENRNGRVDRLSKTRGSADFNFAADDLPRHVVAGSYHENKKGQKCIETNKLDELAAGRDRPKKLKSAASGT